MRRGAYDEGELEDAGRLAEMLSRASQPELRTQSELRALLETAAQLGTDGALDPTEVEVAFAAAMDRDLDSPQRWSLWRGWSKHPEGKRAGMDVRAAQKALRRLGGVFGLRLDAVGPEERVLQGWRLHPERFDDRQQPVGRIRIRLIC